MHGADPSVSRPGARVRQQKERAMAKKKTSKLSLRPIEAELKEIVKKLKKQLPKAKSVGKGDDVEDDIEKVEQLIESIPPFCHRYDVGI
jgi:hypothetical protein